MASCLDTLGPVVLQDFTDKEDLALCLKASANIPVIAGPPMRHRCPAADQTHNSKSATQGTQVNVAEAFLLRGLHKHPGMLHAPCLAGGQLAASCAGRGSMHCCLVAHC